MATDQAKRIGRRIRERREELELTQKQLAMRMTANPGADNQQVSDWERGVHRPSDDNLEIIASALETDVVDLMQGPIGERKPKPVQTPDVMAAMNGDGLSLAEINEKLDEVLRQQEVIVRMLRMGRRTEQTRPTVAPETADRQATPRRKRAENRRAGDG